MARGARGAARRGEAQSAEQLVATYSDLKPADLANTLLDLPERAHASRSPRSSPTTASPTCSRRCPKSEQVDILGQLGDDRAADVLDQMQPDDAADLHRPAARGARRGTSSSSWSPRRPTTSAFLLSYGPDTAGGLMTTEPIIVSADATVAEGLALIRRHELHPALGAAVCVTLPPYEPPTGRFLGIGALPADAALPAARAPRHAASTTASSPCRADTLAPPRSRASSRATTSSRCPSSTRTIASSGW